MTYLDKVKLKVQKTLTNQFVRNLSWLGLSEIVIRILRLLTTIVLARFLTKEDYGLAAIILTTQEFLEVFTRTGIAAKLIQADEKHLEDLCNSAYWLNWVIFIGVFIFQCSIAFPVAWFYENNRLILPICVTALIYLTVPPSSINGALIQRENRLNIVALNQGVCISLANISSLLLAYFGAGFWAIVLPRLLLSPVWFLMYYLNHPWRPTGGFTTEKWDEIFAFGKNILGVQLLDTLRNNLDYLLVGRFLGLQELGIYYFAFNAGLGISLSIIKAIESALLPHLCSLRSNYQAFKKHYFKSLKIIAIIIIPLVLLQSSLAPIYVPIVFGEKWIPAIPVLMLICLSAIPRPFSQASSQLLTAVGRPNLDLWWNIGFTLIFILSLLVGVSWGSIGVATAVLLVHFITIPLFVWLASRYALRISKQL